MRKLLLPLLAAGLAAPAQAQDYRPFRMGLTYQFSESTTPGDTTHTLRIIGRSQAGADTVFRFNPMAQPLPANSSIGCGGTHMQRPNNLFGATLTVPAAGSFVLTASNGRTLTLRPRAAVGQAWVAAPGLTGTVSARTMATVLGQADSVATIGLSNGQTLQLSKQFGLVEGPALIALLDGRYRSRALTLTALPELNRGTAQLGTKAVFDFQPNDVFQRHYTTINSLTSQLCSEGWTRDSIISRTTSAGGDSIIYQIWSRSLSFGYGSPGAPAQFCGSSGTSFFPGAVSTMVVASGSDSNVKMLTNNYSQRYPPFGSLARAASRSAQFNNRLEQEVLLRSGSSCGAGSDSLAITYVIDFWGFDASAQGLGLTRFHHGDMFNDSYMNLEGYRKNGVTYGQLRSFRQLLPAATARPAATTAAFPNPFSNELTVKFELTRPQAVALELHDAIGRVVLTQPATLRAAGTGTLQLNTAVLPAGVYTVFLKPAASPAQVLKVVKQ
ncbi:T9SS type A sorting domain-containing protein [Hymenobacter sp. ASUV-10]|uniref:T9SS type A sorting domain-containing protein n=1 Tax=Hymenobacter aranciens TaxID=3063996 RepID=A0ABT9BH30_9BACT|nr:T9SS type A sorting domain-containing protein [Hymenobacter sp. ASUV-10]MDO7877578.1 T9SS type A sorting domain-containing protein [Hymenobacter sp. ASUV-10]